MRHEPTARNDERRRIGRWVPLAGIAAVGAASAVAIAISASGTGGWGEESVPATGPVASVDPGDPSQPVALSSFPVMVGDELRVTAHEHGITAHPVSVPGDAPAHWRYDRPDHELVRLALSGQEGAGRQTVLSLWDDGLLAAIDATTGQPRWRVDLAGDELAAWQFDPADVVETELLKVVDAEGGDVTVVQVDEVLVGIDVADGAELWRRDEGLCPAAPAPLTGSRWWTIGGHVAVDATCPGPDDLNATVRLIDPRTGEVADEVDSSPPWEPVGPGDGSQVSPVGCRPDLTGCTLVEHGGTGNLGRERPIRWAVQSGGLVEVARTDATGIKAQPNGDFELFALDRATGDRLWKVTGQAHDLRRPQFADADATADAVWVASASWEGGPPALVRLSPTDGSVLGCLAWPTDRPPTRIRAVGGRLVVSDLPSDRSTAFDPDAPDGTVLMLVPESAPAAPTCPDPLAR